MLCRCRSVTLPVWPRSPPAGRPRPGAVASRLVAVAVEAAAAASLSPTHQRVQALTAGVDPITAIEFVEIERGLSQLGLLGIDRGQQLDRQPQAFSG